MALFSRKPNDDKAVTIAVEAEGQSVLHRGWDRQVYHGTLRSELDEPAALPPAFSALAEKIAMLRADYDTGHLTRSQLADALSTAKIVHTDGSLWTLGASSGQWYRKLAGSERWEPSIPPEVSEATATAAVVADPMNSWLGDAVQLGPVGEIPTGVVAAPGAPWPEVSQSASAKAAPEVAPPETVIDDSGAWTTTWESTARSQLGESGVTAAELWALMDETPSDSGSGETVELPPELMDGD